MSDLCWILGLERLSIKFLMKSFTSVEITPFDTPETQEVEVPHGPFEVEVIWYDKEALEDVGWLHKNDIKIAKNKYDIN